ncbi:MAG: LysR family transcriptional regulator [Cereibacter sphaeroides]|uniref:LysR family transcriptional regulator n=1 Tax=Cereibacter sphaeroides TaxID=1063 RepID=A0A2W5S9N1_CERSP|nr:MAG: LysR family transcriptional regulator [Cereibacter sphaeroides]
MAEAQGRVTLWGIEVFLAAAEEGAISAAARRLGASPSAVSQQLSGLEAALGAVLLDRGARPMRLTPAGGMFRRHAQTILNAAAEARAELAMADMSSLTTLRLGMIEDFDADVTPQLLSAMAEELRGCQFLLETGASHRLMDQLDSRVLDVAVAADLGPEFGAGDWAEVHPLLSEPFVVAAPRGAIDPRRDVMAQLQDMPMIQYTARHLMGRQIAAHLMRQNLRLSHRFELDSYHAIMAMVAGGSGWTILTPLGISHAERFRDAVDVLPMPFAPLSRTISLYARAEVLRDMPGRMAGLLRPLLQSRVVDPAVARLPWLDGQLRVL